MIDDMVLGTRWLDALRRHGARTAPQFARAIGRGRRRECPAQSWPALFAALYQADVTPLWQEAALSWRGESRHWEGGAGAPFETGHGGCAAGNGAPGGAGGATTPPGPDAHRWYWRADPVHLAAGLDSLALAFAGERLALTADEAAALVAALDEHFAPDGLRFTAPVPHRWYLALPAALDATAPAPQRIEGGNVHRHLPRGPGGQRLVALLNECQMVLGAHPVNVRREARGLPAVNSVWFWGGGARIPEPPPPALAARLPLLVAADPVLRGLWRSAGLAGAVLPPAAASASWFADPARWFAAPGGTDADPGGTAASPHGGAGAAGADARGRLLVLDDALMPQPAGGSADPGEAAAALLERAFQGWLARRARTRRRGGGAGVPVLRVIGAGQLVELTGPGPWWRRPRAPADCFPPSGS